MWPTRPPGPWCAGGRTTRREPTFSGHGHRWRHDTGQCTLPCPVRRGDALGRGGRRSPAGEAGCRPRPRERGHRPGGGGRLHTIGHCSFMPSDPRLGPPDPGLLGRMAPKGTFVCPTVGCATDRAVADRPEFVAGQLELIRQLHATGVRLAVGTEFDPPSRPPHGQPRPGFGGCGEGRGHRCPNMAAQRPGCPPRTTRRGRRPRSRPRRQAARHGFPTRCGRLRQRERGRSGQRGGTRGVACTAGRRATWLAAQQVRAG